MAVKRHLSTHMNTNCFRNITTGLTCALATLVAASLHAGPVTLKNPVVTNPLPAEGQGWWFRAAPYAWITAIEGDVGIGPLAGELDISMKDTLDTLDMGYMGVFELGHGRLSLGLDMVYGKTSDDYLAGGRLFRSFRYEQKQWIFTPFLAFNIVESERFKLDVFAGARITALEGELTGRFVRGGELVASRDTDFVDPIVGARAQVGLTDKLFVRLNGDVGGFDVSSELVWQAFAGLGYQITDSVGIAAGYRGLGVDYEKDGFAMDTVTHGPVVGLEVRF